MQERVFSLQKKFMHHREKTVTKRLDKVEMISNQGLAMAHELDASVRMQRIAQARMDLQQSKDKEDLMM